jgi:hypothetical protein
MYWSGRSFPTMHSSLMSSIGVRPEVTRDNMGDATVDVTQNIYNCTWWEERVEAVSMAAATVWQEPRKKIALAGSSVRVTARMSRLGNGWAMKIRRLHRGGGES